MDEHGAELGDGEYVEERQTEEERSLGWFAGGDDAAARDICEADLIGRLDAELARRAEDFIEEARRIGASEGGTVGGIGDFQGGGDGHATERAQDIGPGCDPAIKPSRDDGNEAPERELRQREGGVPGGMEGLEGSDGPTFHAAAPLANGREQAIWPGATMGSMRPRGLRMGLTARD